LKRSNFLLTFMARRYGIWYEWKGGVEEAKMR
jgi:hypothetical protein